MRRFALIAAVILFTGCPIQPKAVSSSGVNKATTTVQTGSDGLTAEQRNIMKRLKIDNEPGSIKHLYVISASSGQVLIYSTVSGKVTSGGKRLTPNTVTGSTVPDRNQNYGGFAVEIGGSTQITNEVLQDDGTYGTSMDYLYWFDSKGVFHQHYVGGGQIVHVSSEPLAIKNVVLNMELSDKDAQSEAK